MLGLCLELYSYSVMMSYNYTNNYAPLSYLEYPILLVQEYFLVYFVFKYKNLLSKKTLIFALVYSLLAIMIYFKCIPVIVFAMLVVCDLIPRLLRSLSNIFYFITAGLYTDRGIQ